MPHLVVISTGGTIATTAGTDGVLRPAQSGAALVSAAGLGPDTDLDIDVVDLMSVDSSQLTPADWLKIRDAAEHAVAAGADGVVITHGSDTIEETALWLDLTYDGDTPVVLTCGVRPSDDPDPDGPGNLRDALRVAASPAARGLGVLLSFSGTVFTPLGTTKQGGTAVFGGTTPLGHVADSRESDAPVITLPGERERPYLGRVTSAPRVDIVMAYPGSDGTALDAFTAAGARGLVVEAMGAGNVGAATIEAVARACRRGVAVAVTSRVRGAQTLATYGPGHDLTAAGAIMVPRLQSSQARVLVMAALGAGLPVGDIVTRLG
ncbi:MAG: asparaginase [Mycobacterium sp.]|nr:asparaginase [Mycobacterium sp.]